MPLSAVLDMPGLDRIAGRTVNVYLGHMQHFFGWAANNGYVNENLFLGMRVKRTSKADTGSTGRTAFSSDELRSMFMHLTDETSALSICHLSVKTHLNYESRQNSKAAHSGVNMNA